MFIQVHVYVYVVMNTYTTTYFIRCSVCTCSYGQYLFTITPPSLASLFISSGNHPVLGSTPMALMTKSAPYDLPLLRCTVTGHCRSSPSSCRVLDPLSSVVGCFGPAPCCCELWVTWPWFARFVEMFVTSTPYSRVILLVPGPWASFEAHWGPTACPKLLIPCTKPMTDTKSPQSAGSWTP